MDINDFHEKDTEFLAAQLTGKEGFCISGDHSARQARSSPCSADRA
jgi:hypothetical protein